MACVIHFRTKFLSSVVKIYFDISSYNTRKKWLQEQAQLFFKNMAWSRAGFYNIRQKIPLILTGTSCINNLAFSVPVAICKDNSSILASSVSSLHLSFSRTPWMIGIFILSLTDTVSSNILHILFQIDLFPLTCLPERVCQVCKCPQHGLCKWRPI